jgi:hypothetical protein
LVRLLPPEDEPPDLALEEELPDFALEEELPDFALEEELPDFALEEELPDFALEEELPDFALEEELPDLPLDELRLARDRLVPADPPLRLRLLLPLLPPLDRLEAALPLPPERLDAELPLPLDRFDPELPCRVAWEDRLRPELARSFLAPPPAALETTFSPVMLSVSFSFSIWSPFRRLQRQLPRWASWNIRR